MNEFVRRHASSVIGTLSGFDRPLFRGTLLRIASAGGLVSMLCHLGVLLKEFGDWSMALTEQLKAASLAAAARDGRPVRYLPDPSVRARRTWPATSRPRTGSNRAGSAC